ncbi:MULTISPECIES: hypothetical protein [Marinomonas]|uniref:Uncharacterized protein n=1 Tax=Marinomonas alcarazii TaxID=491949 RepID=A0A318V942_9GAMM|nr:MULTISPECIES: hypothetical protein [Marinomonas]PYF84187.1 hypothetical protein DFP75_101212 [Marinomonas alcarazii]
MSQIPLIDIFHLSAMAITVGCFLFISAKRVIELCSNTNIEKS